MLFNVRQLLSSALIASTLVSSSPLHHNDDSIVDWGRLSSILDGIDSTTLHNVLNNLAPKFKEGVFSKDRAAIEHVHSENPVMASKLVYMAKRQSNESTTAVVVVGSQTTTVTSRLASSQRSSSSDLRAASTTTPRTVDSSVSAALSSQVHNTASATPSPTVVVVAPSTPIGATPVSTVPGGVVFSTTGGGLVTRTSSAVSVSFTKSTSTHLYYTTLPDGTVQTSTDLVIVNAPVTDSPTATNAAAASSQQPGLQTNMAQPGNVVGGAGAIVGLIGFLFAL